MKANEIRITIASPQEKVFEYTLEPKNTPQWVSDVIEMKTDTDQIDLGTKYFNEFITREVIDYDRNSFIELADVEGPYSCSYSFRKIDDEHTELIYFESHSDGSEIEYPMDKQSFERLKNLLEKNN